LRFENIWVIGNRFPESLKEALIKEIEKLSEDNVKLLGFIPEGSTIGEYNFLGKNLLEVPEDDPTYQQAKQIFGKII